MIEQNQEILRITQEECSEVIQAISKVLRFGLDTEWKGTINKDHLTEECGDLLAMIELMCMYDLIAEDQLDKYAAKKIAKLLQWSHIFESNK